MYRLVVVSGPGRGTAFKISDGESTIGRQLGNTVVLPSSQVSKRHCVLVAKDGEILVRDQGSANGTYVNGVLAKNKQIHPGDRIGVGEYILELSGSRSHRDTSPEALPIGVGAEVIAFPGSQLPAEQAPASEAVGLFEAAQPPKDLLGKAFWGFENYVMPFFYGMNLKNEWRIICAIVFGAFLLLNLSILVEPLLDANTGVIVRESKRRAAFMARVIAEKNSAALAANQETHTEIGLPIRAGVTKRGEAEADSRFDGDGVTLAVLTDLDLRIIAPAQRMNQYLISGSEVKFAKLAANAFRKGYEVGFQQQIGDDSVVAIEPVKVSQGGKNVVVAMAIVGLDISTAVMGVGELGIVYSQTLIITGLLGALALLILYRLTLKPFQVLNEDMDKALKGDLPQVTHEFKLEELNPLWDLINSAIQRLPRSSAQGDPSSESQEIDPEIFVGPIRAMADSLGTAVTVCGPDRRVVYMSSAFERITGIRAETAVGHEFTQLGTDQSVGAMVEDLFDRLSAGGDAVTDDKEFSGSNHQLYAAAFGVPGDATPRAYVLTVIAKQE